MLKHTDAFTLIEVIISITILTILLSLGMLYSTALQQNFVSTSEQSTLINLLSRARGQAQNNIHQTRHGVCYKQESHSYVLFEGYTYDAMSSSNISISANSHVSVESSPNIISCIYGLGVVFTQLSGTSTPVVIVIHQESHISTTTVNYEGAIIY